MSSTDEADCDFDISIVDQAHSSEMEVHHQTSADGRKT